MRDLQARSRRDPDQRADGPRRRGRRGLPHRRGEIRGDRRRRSSDCQQRGQPVLVGTISIEKSELLSSLLQASEGIPHEVLNAKLPRAGSRDRRPGRASGRRHHRHQHGRPRHRHPARRQSRDAHPQRARRDDAEARRARRRASTRSAPRSTRHKEKALAAGGLLRHRHRAPRSRRIDNQLRGRSGRQGDPGRSQVLPVARRRPDAHLRLRRASTACCRSSA